MPASPRSSRVSSDARNQEKCATTSQKDESEVNVHRLYNECFKQLVGFLRAKFGIGPPPPEDIAQSAFEKLLNTSDLTEAKNPKAYLWRVACNLAISERRHLSVVQNHQQKTVESGLQQGYQQPPENVLTTRAEIELVYEVLLSMPPQRRKAFMLVRIDGLTQSETAAKMGISRPAVTKHLAKAMESIVERLGS